MSSMTIQNHVEAADIEKIDIHGKLWNDVHGNTYHSCTVSVLLKGADKYTDLGFIPFRYGYDYCYEDAGRMIMKEAINGWNPKEEALHWMEKEMGVDINSRKEWVKRKRDL